MGMVKRGEVYWVELDPTRGSEIRKTRPCLIISTDDMNAVLPRILVVPITSKGQPLGCRPVIQFQGRKGIILLDQIRCVDKVRLGKKMGELPKTAWHSVLLDMLE